MRVPVVAEECAVRPDVDMMAHMLSPLQKNGVIGGVKYGDLLSRATGNLET